MNKYLIAIIAAIIHFITNLIVQATIMGLVIFCVTLSLSQICSNTGLCIALVLVDYFINTIIQHKRKVRIKSNALHLFDLFLIIPGMSSILFEFIKKPITTISKSFITVTIILLLVDAILVTERIILIRREKRQDNKQ